MSDVSLQWPRNIIPQTATYPEGPTSLFSVGTSGFVQVRATTQVGRTWTETYPPLRPTDTTRPYDAAFLAFVQNAWRNQLLFMIDHRSQRVVLGTGVGTPLINGALQVGDVIETNGWGHSQTVLKAGDIVKFAGARLVYDITLDVISDSSGIAALTINPPVFTGWEPTNGGAVVVNNPTGTVKYKCRIAALQMPHANADQWYQGMSITFDEVINP